LSRRREGGLPGCSSHRDLKDLPPGADGQGLLSGYPDQAGHQLAPRRVQACPKQGPALGALRQDLPGKPSTSVGADRRRARGRALCRPHNRGHRISTSCVGRVRVDGRGDPKSERMEEHGVRTDPGAGPSAPLGPWANDRCRRRQHPVQRVEPRYPDHLPPKCVQPRNRTSCVGPQGLEPGTCGLRVCRKRAGQRLAWALSCEFASLRYPSFRVVSRSVTGTGRRRRWASRSHPYWHRPGPQDVALTWRAKRSRRTRSPAEEQLRS
jgi:hypothetical protein